MAMEGQKVFVYYNGPTDQLSGVSAGACVLDPGASPHPPHQHPEEEFLIVGEGTGEIVCDGKVTQVGVMPELEYEPPAFGNTSTARSTNRFRSSATFALCSSSRFSSAFLRR